MRQPSIEVEIESLVLQGFPPGAERVVASTFQQALAEALGSIAARGQLPAGLASDRGARVLEVGSFQVAPNAAPATVAASAAASLARGLGNGGWR